MNFFEMCEIETSLFDIDFANSNADWAMIKDAYEKNLAHNSDDCKIPKIIHFIWLGSELPEKYESIIDGWRKHNPDFESGFGTTGKLKPFCRR